MTTSPRLDFVFHWMIENQEDESSGSLRIPTAVSMPRKQRVRKQNLTLDQDPQLLSRSAPSDILHLV